MKLLALLLSTRLKLLVMPDAVMPLPIFVYVSLRSSIVENVPVMKFVFPTLSVMVMK